MRGETILIPKISEANTTGVQNEIVNQPVQPKSDYYKIQLQENLNSEIPESCKPQNLVFGETYNIALFLPFFMEANDTLNRMPLEMVIDSIKTADSTETTGLMEPIDSTQIDSFIDPHNREDMFNEFYGNSENYFQFYEGVLVAVDSMQKEGMNIVLNVYDTQNNSDSIRKYISSEDFLKSDLIIGPVNPTVQKDVASLAAKNRIPMVSPLYNQSNEVQNNPYYFQVNPDREYLAEKTADLIAEEYFNSNFIVFKTSNYTGTLEGKLVSLIQEKLYNSGYLGNKNGANFSIYDFQNDGAFGLRRILSHNKENVIYIPSSNEGELSIAISNINNLADDFPITLIGSNRYQNYESIEVDYFHNLKLEYVAPYWIDYKNPATIWFIGKFKNLYFTEPNNFSIQGYDVTFYFLNALKNYGRDFRQCLPYMRLNLIQGNYHFEKISQFGGYVNHGVSLIEYQRNYDVVRKQMDSWINLASN